MNMDQLEIALRQFSMRRPFRSFAIEFTSGFQASIRHPEAIRKFGGVYVLRAVSGEYCVFATESVVRVLDVSVTTPSA